MGKTAGGGRPAEDEAEDDDEDEDDEEDDDCNLREDTLLAKKTDFPYRNAFPPLRSPTYNQAERIASNCAEWPNAVAER